MAACLDPGRRTIERALTVEASGSPAFSGWSRRPDVADCV
jgi:hypothetical protein